MMQHRGPASISENSNLSQHDFDSRHGANRQLADFGIQGKPVSNVQNIGNNFKNIRHGPTNSYNIANLESRNDGMHQFEDCRSEYSVGGMSLRTVQPALRGTDLPIVNYTNPNKVRNNSRSTYRDGSNERISQRLSNSPHRQQMEQLGLNQSNSTTTFSQMSGPGVKPGQNYIGITSVSHRSQFDENAVPQQAELQAMIEEQKTQDKIRAKQNQVEQFRAKTATAA